MSKIIQTGCKVGENHVDLKFIKRTKYLKISNISVCTSISPFACCTVVCKTWLSWPSQPPAWEPAWAVGFPGVVMWWWICYDPPSPFLPFPPVMNGHHYKMVTGVRSAPGRAHLYGGIKCWTLASFVWCFTPTEPIRKIRMLITGLPNGSAVRMYF